MIADKLQKFLENRDCYFDTIDKIEIKNDQIISIDGTEILALDEDDVKIMIRNKLINIICFGNILDLNEYGCIYGAIDNYISKELMVQ